MATINGGDEVLDTIVDVKVEERCCREGRELRKDSTGTSSAVELCNRHKYIQVHVQCHEVDYDYIYYLRIFYMLTAE